MEIDCKRWLSDSSVVEDRELLYQAQEREARAMLRDASLSKQLGESLIRSGQHEGRAGVEILRRIAAERKGV